MRAMTVSSISADSGWSSVMKTKAVAALALPMGAPAPASTARAAAAAAVRRCCRRRKGRLVTMVAGAWLRFRSDFMLALLVGIRSLSRGSAAVLYHP